MYDCIGTNKIKKRMNSASLKRNIIALKILDKISFYAYVPYLSPLDFIHFYVQPIIAQLVQGQTRQTLCETLRKSNHFPRDRLSPQKMEAINHFWCHLC